MYLVILKAEGIASLKRGGQNPSCIYVIVYTVSSKYHNDRRKRLQKHHFHEATDHMIIADWGLSLELPSVIRDYKSRL